MAEKRFCSEDYTVGYYTEIVDNEKVLDLNLDNPSKRLLINECVDVLNALYEENQQLKLELDIHKHPLWSTREAERKINELTNLLSNETKKNAILLEEMNSLRIENMRLKR